MSSRCAVAALIIAAGSLFGCQSTKTTDAGAEVRTVNSTCPVAGNAWSENGSKTRPAALTRTYKGDTVGFCCQGCASKWDAMTDAERAQKLRQ
jgi:hypothetical protein